MLSLCVLVWLFFFVLPGNGETQYVQIMGLYDIHAADNTNGLCGDDIEESLAILAVAHNYEIQQANNYFKRNGINIIINSTMYDSCTSDAVGIRNSMKIMQQHDMAGQQNRSTPLMLSPFAILTSSTSGVAKVLSVMANESCQSIPVISSQATTPELDNEKVYPNFVRTMPSDTYQVQALYSTLINLNLTWVNVVGDQTDYSSGLVYAFRDLVDRNKQLCIEKLIVVESGNNMWNDIFGQLGGSASNITLLLVGTQEATEIIQSMNESDAHLFVGVDSWSTSMRHNSASFSALRHAITTEPKAIGIIDPKFKNYMEQTSLSLASRQNNNALVQLIQYQHNCNGGDGNYQDLNRDTCSARAFVNDNWNKSCTGNEIYNWNGTDINTLFVRESVKMIVAALESLENGTFDNHGTGIDNVTGFQLINYFKNTNFTDYCGDVNENKTCIFQLDGNSGSPYYTIYEYYGNATNIIGHWTANKSSLPLNDSSSIAIIQFVGETRKCMPNNTCGSKTPSSNDPSQGKTCCYVCQSCYEKYNSSLPVNQCQKCDRSDEGDCIGLQNSVDCFLWLQNFEACLPFQEFYVVVLHVLSTIGAIFSLTAMFLFYSKSRTPTIRLLGLRNFTIYPLSTILMFLVGPFAILASQYTCQIAWFLLSIAMVLPPTSANLRLRRLRIMRSDISINKYIRRASTVPTSPSSEVRSIVILEQKFESSLVERIRKYLHTMNRMIKTSICAVFQLLVTSLWAILRPAKIALNHAPERAVTETYCSALDDQFTRLLFVIPMLFTLYNIYVAYWMTRHTQYATPVRESRQIISSSVLTLILIMITMIVFYDDNVFVNDSLLLVSGKLFWIYIYAMCKGLITTLLNILPDVLLVISKEKNHIDYLLKRRGPKSRPKGIVGYFSEWRQRTNSRSRTTS